MKRYPKRVNNQKSSREGREAGQTAVAIPRTCKVFVSYSHDSPEHGKVVLSLAHRLRSDGIDAVLDQYEQSPPFGWPYWMEEQIRTADFVLIVCTKLYRQHVEHFESISDSGKGVLWESNIIYNHIYIARLRNDKFIPVLISGASPECVPTPLKGFTYYSPENEEGYDSLYRRIVGNPLVKRPPLGQKRALRSINQNVGDLIRDEEKAARSSWLHPPRVKPPLTSDPFLAAAATRDSSSADVPASTKEPAGMQRAEGSAFLTEKLESNISFWRSRSLGAAMLIIDVDKLTQINTAFGSRIGDAVLYAVYELLAHSLADFSGRCGDDTFYATFLNVSEVRGTELAQDLCDAISRLDWNELAVGLWVTCSVGLAHFDNSELSIDWPIRAAIGMRKAKEEGGNRVATGPSMLPVSNGSYRVSRKLADYFS